MNVYLICHLDWKRDHETYSCPRYWRLSASWGPLETPPYITALLYGGFKGSLMMLRDTIPGGHFLPFDRDSRFNACWTRGQNQHAETLSFWCMHEMCGCRRSLHFSSSNMESDEECDAVIVAAVIETFITVLRIQKCTLMIK